MQSILMNDDASTEPKPPILIWDFYDAPHAYRAFSTHGGDEDGLVFIPKGVEEPYWLEKLWSNYGGEDRIALPDGTGTLIIWAHA